MSIPIVKWFHMLALASADMYYSLSITVLIEYSYVNGEKANFCPHLTFICGVMRTDLSSSVDGFAAALNESILYTLFYTTITRLLQMLPVCCGK